MEKGEEVQIRQMNRFQGEPFKQYIFTAITPSPGQNTKGDSLSAWHESNSRPVWAEPFSLEQKFFVLCSGARCYHKAETKHDSSTSYQPREDERGGGLIWEASVIWDGTKTMLCFTAIISISCLHESDISGMEEQPVLSNDMDSMRQGRGTW